MPNEKQFDFATIAVIIVSIILILCGFYLLNQSFTKKQEPSKLTYNVSSSSVSSSSNNINDIIQSLNNQNISSNESTISSSFSSFEGVVESSEKSSSSSDISSSSTISSTTQPSELKSTEAVVKVVAIEGPLYKIEVLDTGYTNGKLWTVGKQFRISSTKNMELDKEYILSGISEENGESTIALIKEKIN